MKVLSPFVPVRRRPVSFLLLSTAALETTLRGIGEFEALFEGGTLRQSSVSELLRQRVRGKTLVYRRELRRILKLMCATLLLSSCVLAAVCFGRPAGTERWAPARSFALGTLGYAGLLMALFNKLFLGQTRSAAALRGIVLGVLGGLAVSVPLLRYSGQVEVAGLATLVGGWAYCMYVQRTLCQPCGEPCLSDDAGTSSVADEVLPLRSRV